MGRSMEWHKLLSHNRLRRPSAVLEKGRSPFQQDIDRITFSAAFRRLAYKTQVHPLSPNDHVHTRLTHSIEVACVGRSLGTGVGAEIAAEIEEIDECLKITQDTFGYVVQAACLAHDIGNPPFGHFGEYAMRSWFEKNAKPCSRLAVKLDDVRQEDFTLFDGNAQGFRIITQLEDAKWAGGLQLTHAVLGTFTKYPRASNIIKDNYIGGEKPGFLKSEEHYFVEIAEQLGLEQRENRYWSRHPLAFLVEAADDICYKIIDIEDGYELGYLSFSEAKEILGSIASKDSDLTTLPAKESDQIGKLRAVAVGILVKECITIFLQNKQEILSGSFNKPLIELTKFNDQIKTASKAAQTKIFESETITKREIAGEKIIQGLLDMFADVCVNLVNKDFEIEKLKKKERRLARLIGDDSILRANTMYDALLCMTDFVSGMTDRFAVETFRQLTGIST